MDNSRREADAPITPAIEPMRVWRARRGISQIELARLSGVSRQTVSNIERGRTTAHMLVRESLADALEVPADYVTELRY